MATDLAKLVVRLEAENSKLVQGLDKANREIGRFRRDAENAVDSVGRAFKNLAVIGLSVGTFTAVARSIKDVANEADNLSKLSQKVGASVEALSALNYAAELSGVSSDALANGLKRLSANAADTAAGVGEARDAFKALGVDVRNADGSLKGVEKLIGEVADKFAGANDGVNKTAIAMKIFGKAGADLIPLLNGGSEGLAAMRAEAEQLGILLDSETGKAAEQFNDDLTRLGAASKGLSVEIAKTLLPALTDVTKAMAEAAKEGGLLQAAWVALGGLGAALFTDEFQSDVDKLNGLRQELSNLQRQLKNKEGQGLLHDWVFGDDLDIQEEIDRVVAEMDVLQRRIAAAAGSTENVGAAAEDAKEGLKGLRDETTKLSEAQKAAIKEADAYAKRLDSLVASLDPVGAKTEQYLQSVADLDRAWVEGRISGERYDELMQALATDTDALTKAAKEAADAEKEAAKEREEAAKRAQDLAMEPFRNAIEGIQDAFTSAFEDIFSGGVRSFGDLADAVKRIMIRLAAEVATLMVFRPSVVGGLAGAAGLAGSGSAFAGTGGGLGFNPLSAVSSFLGPAGSLLGIGGGIGALGSTLWGGSSLGGSLGGAAGFYGGTLLGSGSLGAVSGALAGTLGTLGNFVIPGLGAVLGGFLGSKLFGKQPSNKSAWGAIDLSSGATSSFGNMTGSKFSQETVDARDSFFQAIGGFSSALQQITGGTLTGSVSADIGLRDGTQVSGLGAGRYADPQQALDAIFRSMMTNIQGIDAEWRNVFARLDLSDMEQAVADLQIAGTIINRDYVQAEPLSEAAAAIRQITDSFYPLIDSANRLGLATAGLYDEQNRLINQLRTDYNESIDQAILAITDPLQAALNEADRVAEERLRNARDLGADLVDVERLNMLERQQIIDQINSQTNSALLQANQSIEQYLTGLRSGSGSFLSPTARLSNAEAEFQALLSAAQGGDVTARAGLTGAAGNLLDASRDVFGSSEMFFQRLGFVESTLGNLVGQSGSTATFDNLGQTIAQGNSTSEYQLGQVIAELRALRAAYAEQQAALDRLVAA